MLRQHHRPGLQRQQLLLARQPPAVAGERPVRTDHSVAGYDDRDRVAIVGATHRTGRAGLTDGGRDLTVGGGLAVGDRAQRAPHIELKRRAAGGKIELELAALAREVLLQLAAQRRERLLVAHPRVACWEAVAAKRVAQPAGGR